VEKSALNGKPVAVITGAGGGMAAAVARAFASEYGSLVLVDLDAGALDALREELTRTGARIRAIASGFRELSARA
jgi:NADP-dependent 3-hydroxy acid dehydrogenase YdfG